MAAVSVWKALSSVALPLSSTFQSFAVLTLGPLPLRHIGNAIELCAAGDELNVCCRPEAVMQRLDTVLYLFNIWSSTSALGVLIVEDSRP